MPKRSDHSEHSGRPERPLRDLLSVPFQAPAAEGVTNLLQQLTEISRVLMHGLGTMDRCLTLLADQIELHGKYDDLQDAHHDLQHDYGVLKQAFEDMRQEH